MKYQEIDHENVDQQIDRFWEHFQLFPSKIERLLFERFSSLVGISIFPYIVMTIGLFIAHTFYGETWEWVIEELTDLQMVIVVLGLLLITPFYFQWQSKIPETFQWLLNSKHITGDENLKQKYLKFLTRYQRTLHHQPFRYSFSVFFCVFVIVFNIMNPYYLDNIQNGLTAGAMIAIIKRVFALLFWGYLSGLIVWPVFATGYHIYKLSKHFEFVVHPRHPDRCGGLKPLGDFCFSMTMPIIISGIILIMLGFGGITPVDIPENETGKDTIMFANILLFVFFLPLTVANFFLPLWNVHLEMARLKVKQEDEFSNEVMKLENQLRESVRKEKGWEMAKAAKEKIEVLQIVNPQKTGFPVWPFRSNLIISLFSPQILGVVGTLLSVFDFFSS